MEKSNFWFVTLISLFVIAENLSWPILLKIAVIANSVIVLMDVAKRGYALFHE